MAKSKSTKSINPFSEEVEFENPLLSEKQVADKIQKSHKASLGWAAAGLEERLSCLKDLARVLRLKKQELAVVIVKEMGKTKKSAMDEVEKCAFTVEYLSEKLLEWSENKPVEMPAGKHHVTFSPMGVTLGIMPWNFPLWQAVRFLAPSLAVGNSVLLKPASNVFQSSILLEKCLIEAGFPEGVYQHLGVSSGGIQGAIENPLVKGVSLTGSTSAGKQVASIAGPLMKKMVFELGGSDPYIVLEDADLELAAQKCAETRLINAGQSCVSGKRFLVAKKVAEEFMGLFVNEMASFNYGDPMSEDTYYGPLARKDLRKDLQDQVDRAIEDGGDLVLGGETPRGTGCFYPASIIYNLPKKSELFNEEFFGPVALVNEFESEEEAFQMANQTPFGLGSGIFSKDVKRATKLAEERLQFGMCAINDYIKSDVRLPFGGVKDSGFGRELGPYGVHEFANIKSISAY